MLYYFVSETILLYLSACVDIFASVCALQNEAE